MGPEENCKLFVQTFNTGCYCANSTNDSGETNKQTKNHSRLWFIGILLSKPVQPDGLQPANVTSLSETLWSA